MHFDIYDDMNDYISANLKKPLKDNTEEGSLEPSEFDIAQAKKIAQSMKIIEPDNFEEEAISEANIITFI